MADRRDLTDGPVRGHLLRLGAPMIVGIIGVLSISLADAFFLGRLGPGPLTAISFTFPVVLTLQSLGIGLSAGAASVASRAIGAGRADRARRLATDAVLLSVLVVIALTAAGLVVVRPLFALLGAEGAVLDDVVAYMRIWFFGLPFLVVPMVANGLIRANGDGVAPSAIMVVAALINVGLDPLLIYGIGPFPRLEIEGAAWASLASRVVTFVLAVGILALRERLLTFTVPPVAEVLSSWGEVLRVGAPAALSTSVNPLAITVVTGVLSRFGDDTVAAFGVATRIEALACVPLLALSAAIGPVAGQNWGAGRVGRVREALTLCFWTSTGWALVLAGAFWLFGEGIASVFTDEPAVVEGVARYLRITGFTLVGYGVVVTASAAFNATGRAGEGLGMTALRSMVLYAPLAVLGARLGAAGAAYAGIAAANLLSGGIVAWWALSRTKDRARLQGSGVAGTRPA